jgi:acetyl-CoA synthetase
MKHPKPHLSNYDKACEEFSWDTWSKEFSFKKNGKVNYAYEVTDYQVKKGNGNKPAITSQNAAGKVRRITFAHLARATTVLAGALKKRGLKPGDRFGIYAPKSIEYVIVLLAAIKCGATVVPLFDKFGTEAIADRLGDCGATWLYVDSSLAGNVIFDKVTSVTDVLTDKKGSFEAKQRTYELKDLLKGKPDPSAIHFGDLETPFVIHYTSGSTGKPKGILLVQRAMIGHLVTARYVLDLHPSDKYWNTGDPGWVTGMVYNFFAPFLLGVGAHIYEGKFDATAWMKFMSRMKISVWYSTPTAFRLLRYHGVPLSKKNMPYLRHIVSAGEPLNSSLIDWTMETVGVPIHDSWYMTENGHQLINNYRCVPIRKGSMGKSLPGIRAAIINKSGKEVARGKRGRLAVRVPWPGLMKSVWNNPKKFKSYFEKDWYISGDMAYQDKDGYFWFLGREDDMIKSAAERMGPFEIENALVSHPAVAEAGVIGKPDPIYGSIIKAFIILKKDVKPDDALKKDLVKHVRTLISKHAVPREISFVHKLPKTKSGKIMRRVLRAEEANMHAGDLSTMDVEMNPEQKTVR